MMACLGANVAKAGNFTASGRLDTLLQVDGWKLHCKWKAGTWRQETLLQVEGWKLDCKWKAGNCTASGRLEEALLQVEGWKLHCKRRLKTLLQVEGWKLYCISCVEDPFTIHAQFESRCTLEAVRSFQGIFISHRTCISQSKWNALFFVHDLHMDVTFEQTQPLKTQSKRAIGQFEKSLVFFVFSLFLFYIRSLKGL